MQGLEHSLLSLFSFLVYQGCIFIYLQYLRSCGFLSLPCWNGSPCPSRCPKAEPYPQFAIATMRFPLWYAHFSMGIPSLISTTLFLPSQVCHACSVLSLADPSIHTLAIFAFLFLSLFLQSSPMSVGIRHGLWFPNTSVLPLSPLPRLQAFAQFWGSMSCIVQNLFFLF